MFDRPNPRAPRCGRPDVSHQPLSRHQRTRFGRSHFRLVRRTHDQWRLFVRPFFLAFVSGRVSKGGGRIVANANECVPLGSGRNPNFVLMDYVNLGSPSQAVDQLNGLS